MFKKLNHILAIGFTLTFILSLIFFAVALADDISNNLDSSIDAVAEVMSLNSGGAVGTTQLYVQPRNGDAKDGCNLSGQTEYKTKPYLTVSVQSSDTSVATVSPTSITFNSCGDTPTLTVTSHNQGSSTISLNQTYNDTGATFNLAPATFTVNVAPPPNTPPHVTITGVTGGTSYEIGSVPAAICYATDAEDGNSYPDVTLSAVSGPQAAYGLGEQTASCSYTDAGGLTASASVTYGIVDTTDPVITFVGRTAANGNGWNNGDVMVTWSCTDAGTGVVDAFVTQTVTTEGVDQPATGICTDYAGNTASDTQTGINIDKTAPTIDAVPDRAANGSGWYNADVTVTFVCDDALSGVADCTAPAVLGEGTNQSAAGTATDKAGNTANAGVSGINIDKTAPTISGAPDRAANSFGWYNADVTVSFTCGDALSGVVECSEPSTLAEGANQSVTGTAKDAAGNTASAIVSGINIDKTAPTISAAPDRAANANGWYNADVTVSFTCGDALSGVLSCPADVVLGEGANQSTSGTVTDKAGNTANAGVSGINIDKTVPTVSLVGGPANGASYYFGFVPAAPTCSASDALSGLDGSCSVSGYDAAVGSHTVTASVKDLAGNSASAGASYTVLAWTPKGFYQPVDMTLEGQPTVWNVVKNGSTVPLKFELFAGSLELTLTSYVIQPLKAVGVTCGTGTADDIELTATGSTALRYDTTGGQFIYNWQTPKIAGACYKVTVSFLDGSFLSAFFKLK